MFSHDTINTIITSVTGASVTGALLGLRSAVVKLVTFIEQINEDHGQIEKVTDVVDGHSEALTELGVAHAFPKLRQRRKGD